MPYPEIERMGYFLPVIEAHAQYRKAARYDDLLVVTTIVKDIPTARIRIEYTIRLDNAGDFLAEGYTIHSFVHAATGKPTRAPAQFVEALTGAMAKMAVTPS